MLDAKTGQPAETYRYSAFDEETILIAQEQPIADSQLGNPWRFACKRIDPETGWIYFGQRYYDPEIGRWTTPDPAGFVDGPNLYAYLHHNPLMAFDADGLLGEAYRDFCKPEFSKTYFASYSNDHDFPTRPDRSDHIHERADYIDNNLYNGTVGAFHAGIDHVFDHYYGYCLLGSVIGSNDLDQSYEERMAGIASITMFDNWVMDKRGDFDDSFRNSLRVDSVNIAYQMGRQYTTMGIEIVSIATIALGVVNYGGKFSAKIIRKLLLHGRTTKIASQVARKELKYFSLSANATVRHDLDALSKAGQVLDRNGLTRAGRALEKHGGRVGSVFPKATGNPINKNLQGQYHLDDILTHPNNKILKDGSKGIEIYTPDGRGTYFRQDGSFRGFIEENFR